ncbi:MAG: hypothetical protein GY940_40930, partial [bacterium]|nr:hypothetical protein [bacterium]
LRVGLIKEEKRKHILMVDMHHIICDGLSHRVLIEDFIALYEGKELPRLRLQYRDFSNWRNNEDGKGTVMEQENYWLDRFSNEVPVINLPTDYVRPGMQRFEGEWLPFTTQSNKGELLNQLALEEGVSVFMVLLAIFNILLSKISGDEDIVVGTGVDGRGAGQLEGIIGMFVNTLALRNVPRSNDSFRDFLAQLKINTLPAFENQDYPFEDIVD